MKWVNRKGQSLIEVMAAVLIVAIAITAIVEMSTKSTANAGLAKRQAQATALATDKMETLRADKEAANWDAFCGTADQTDTSGVDFSRTSHVSCFTNASGRQQMTITVTVSWAEKGITKSIKQEIVYTRY